jgi:hypothetical protein
VSSWDAQGSSKDVVDAIGIMTYQGSQSLSYVGNYDGTSCTLSWCALCSAAKVSTPCGFAPGSAILAGLGGDASTSDVQAVCGHTSKG